MQQSGFAFDRFFENYQTSVFQRKYMIANILVYCLTYLTLVKTKILHPSDTNLQAIL